jgi:phosphoserine phosphatase
MTPVLAVDFDETITTADTVARLPELAAEGLSPSDAQDRARSWEAGVSKYVAEWRETFAAVLASPPDAPTAPERVDAFSRIFWDIENGSLDAIERRGLLQGIRREALTRCGEGIVKRDGVDETLAEARRRRFDVHIVSANWSVDMLRGAVGDGIPIHSNDLEFGADGTTTGRFLRNMISARDKRTRLRELAQERGRVVYVGDGMNDLAALMEADLGIVIGQKPDMMRVCKALRIPMHGVCDAAQVVAGESVLRVDGWDEIAAPLFEQK